MHQKTDYAYKNHQLFCGPDWTSLSWEQISIISYEEEIKKIVNASLTIPIIDKVAWFGNVFSPSKRKMEYYTRSLLLDYSMNFSQYFDFKHGNIITI